jgi:hypothetical protein
MKKVDAVGRFVARIDAIEAGFSVSGLMAATRPDASEVIRKAC